MTEPDVTLTDYALTLECAAFAQLLRREPGTSPLRPWFVLFFAASAIAPLLGGTVHGFFSDPASWGQRLLWPAAVLSIGVSSFAVFGLGARLGFSPDTARRLVHGGAALLLVWSALVLWVDSSFRMAVRAYVPAATFLLVGVLAERRRNPRPGLLLAAVGVLVTFGAAALQQRGVGWPALGLSHNALYHVIQGAALYLLFRGGRALVRAPAC